MKVGSNTNNLFLRAAFIIFFASFADVSIGIKVGSLTPSNIPVLMYPVQTTVIPT